MRRFAGTARKIARGWWPESIAVALLTAIAFAGQKDDALFSVFCFIVMAIAWAMGRRHRLTPLHAKLDRIGNVVNETYAAVLAEDVQDDQDEQGVRNTTHLRVIR